MRPRKLFARIQSSHANIRFGDFERLVRALGFRRVDGQGSHRTYEHSRFPAARLNLQPINGQAKPYQVKQLLAIVEEYDLSLDKDDDAA